MTIFIVNIDLSFTIKKTEAQHFVHRFEHEDICGEK